MVLLKRIIPATLAIIVIAIFEFILNPTSVKVNLFVIFAALIFVLLAIVVSLYAIIWEKTAKEFWLFLAPPVIFISNAYLFFLFLERGLIYHVLAFVSGLLMYLYFENLFIYYYLREKYQPYSLENITSYLNVISTFLLASNVICLIIFLGISFWWLALISLILFFLLVLSHFWISKISWTDGKLFIIGISLLLLQILWAVKYFSTAFYIIGLIVAVSYYILTGIGRSHLIGDLDKKELARYLIAGLAIIVITLGFAQWI